MDRLADTGVPMSQSTLRVGQDVRVDPIQLTIVATDGDPDRPTGYLLRDDAGVEYRVTLPTAARHTSAPAVPTQMGIAVEEMTPRHIQMAIRSGMTSQEVADRYGVDLARVQRFEGPVLLERQHIAERARNTSLRRPEGLRPLVDVVTERLDQRGDDSASLEWDSWRRDDGRWIVEATWLTLGSDIGEDSMSTASWLFDNVGRTIVPHDGAARSLVDTQPVEQAKPEPTKPAPGGDPYEGPVTPVDKVVDDISAIADVTSAPAAPTITPSPTWRPVIVEGGLATPPPPPAVELVTDTIAETVAEPVVEVDEFVDEIPVDDVPEVDINDTAPIPKPAPQSGKSRRTSVPSWDEILFGSSPSTRDPD